MGKIRPKQSGPPTVRLHYLKKAASTLRAMPLHDRRFVLNGLAQWREGIPMHAKAIDSPRCYFKWELGKFVILLHLDETRDTCTVLGISLRDSRI
jgi:hypothetical protein